VKLNLKRRKQNNRDKQEKQKKPRNIKIQAGSLRFKIIAYFTAAILFISLIMGLLAISISSRIVTEEAEKGMMALAEEAAIVTQGRIEEPQIVLATMAQMQELTGMNRFVQISALSRMIKHTNFISLAVLDAKEGEAHFVDGTTLDLSDMDFIQKALNGEFTVSEIVNIQISHEPVIMFAAPIVRNEQVAGALIGCSKISVLSDLTNDITYGETGHAYMIDNTGTVVAHKDINLVNNQWNPIKEVDAASSSTPSGESFIQSELESMAASFSEMIENRVGIGSYQLHGKEYMHAYAEVEGTNWIIAVAAEKDDVLSSLPSLTYSLGIVALAVLAAGIIFSFFIGSSFADPIENLTRILGRVADYDLTVDENSPVFKYMKRRDEVGKIAGALMKALESFTDLLKQALASSEMVGATAEELSASVQEISSNTQNQASNSEELSSSMEEMAASINEVSSNMQAAAADVRHISRNMSDIEGLVNTNEGNLHRIEQSLSAILESLDEARKSINTISDRSQVASREAEVTVTLADEGKQNLDKTVTQMETIQDTIDNLAEVMNGLGESATQIGDITDMIKDVAEQTNLLALNASIEAARAGEHGKGFAVVAQAIGSLAEESQNATKEIAKVIRNIQAEIAKAVQRSEEGTRVVESGTELVKTTSGSLEKIFEAIQLTSEIIHEITDLMNTQAQDINRVYESADDINNKVSDLMKAMKEETESTADINQKLASLSKVIDEISEAMNQQSAAAEQVTHAVNENAAGIEEISLSSEEIARSADDLARSAQELVQQVQRFNI
jgi:methyl-accepting chemotaxis protein